MRLRTRRKNQVPRRHECLPINKSDLSLRALVLQRFIKPGSSWLSAKSRSYVICRPFLAVLKIRQVLVDLQERWNQSTLMKTSEKDCQNEMLSNVASNLSSKRKITDQTMREACRWNGPKYEARKVMGKGESKTQRFDWKGFTHQTSLELVTERGPE